MTYLKSNRLVFFMFIIISMIAIFYIFKMQNVDINKKEIKPNLSLQVYNKALNSVDEKWPTENEVNSIDEIQTNLRFKPKLPSNMPKKMKHIFASKPGEPTKWVWIIYSDEQSPEKEYNNYISININRDIDQSVIDGFYDFINLEPQRLKFVDVNGNKGIGGEPWIKSIQATQEKVFESGVVTWLEGNDEYTILGHDSNTSLDTLLKIARSMK